MAFATAFFRMSIVFFILLILVIAEVCQAAPIPLRVEVGHSGGLVTASGPDARPQYQLTPTPPRPIVTAGPDDSIELLADSLVSVYSHGGYGVESELLILGNEIIWTIRSRFDGDPTAPVTMVMMPMQATATLGTLSPGDYELTTVFDPIDRDGLCLSLQPGGCPTSGGTPLLTPTGLGVTRFTVVPEPASAALGSIVLLAGVLTKRRGV